MIFAFSAGSNGSGPDRFVLYVPFTMSPGREISSIDKEIKHNIKEYKISLEKLTNFYAITVGEFNTIDEAHQFFPKLCSSLLWASLKLKIGISHPKLITEINLKDSPTPIHKDSSFRMITDAIGWNEVEGHYDADEAVVRPEAKKLIKFEMGQPTVIMDIGTDNFVEFISEAISFEAPENVINDDNKLQLAINLYSDSHYQVSDKAKFITLVTVLEALKPKEEIPNIAKEALKSAKSLTKGKRDSYKEDSEEWRELEHLVSRIGGLKKQAIGTAIRKYISGIIKENPELGDQEETLKNVNDIYKLRSDLLHNGIADNRTIKEKLYFLVGFIPKLLEWLYRKEANQ